MGCPSKFDEEHPQVIIRNILKRLPVKSLIRFQCVCKQWKNLIKTSSFIAEHLRHSTDHNPSLVFQRSGSDKGLPLDLCLLDCEKQLHEVQNVPFDSSVSVRIVGSSNGLLCVECSSDRVHSLFLWNPAIRKIIQVNSNVCDFEGKIYVGYGFSPSNNDYKILRAYVPEDEDEVNRVEVYSLSTRRWKEIRLENLKGVNFDSDTVTADGAMFWHDMENDLVVSFNIAMEVFTLIPMPALDKSHKYSGHKLTVYENKLAVISHFVECVSCTTDSYYIDLWVVEDGIGAPQERWGWTKKYSVITFTDLELRSGIWRIDPLCIWRDELVYNGSEMSGIVSKPECEENIGVNEMYGIFGETEWEENINEMFGIFGKTESEENTEVLSVLCHSNFRTNKSRKIATGRCSNEYSVIFNHAESLVPVDSLQIHEVNTTGQNIVDGNTLYLPREIIRNILKRLPVKSLMRFKCVCWQWKNLIKEASFISDHLYHSTHHNPSLLFQRSGSDKGIPLDLCLLDWEKQLHEVQNAPFDSSVHVRIVGSSNGLLCVKCSNGGVHSIFLWNPAIRRLIQVHGDVYDFEGIIYVGYGFSPIVNDYKILRAYVPEDEDEVNLVEVYSLSTQRWKEIKFENLEGVNLDSEFVTAYGAMFWHDVEKDLVVSFDIAMEVFTLIPMPALDKSHKYFGHKLTIYEDKLAVISHFLKGISFTTDSYYIDLWVVEEGIGAPQERWSWTKKYSLITFTDSEYSSGVWRKDPLCIWRDELVCNCNEMSGIVSQAGGQENIEVNEMFGIFGETEREEDIKVNEMFGIFGETESEESQEVLSVLCLSNLSTNKLRKIATGRCSNGFSVIYNHAESLVPIDSIGIQQVHQT